MYNQPFIKMQALGNDFIVIDAIDDRFLLTIEQVIHICSRKLGIGCDQLLVIEINLNKTADFNYRIFNQDGSIAEHCANGARCVVKYLAKKYNKKTISLQTKDRILYGRIITDETIEIDMSQPSFLPQSVLLNQKLNLQNNYAVNGVNCAIVSMGNPHALVRLNLITEMDNLSNLASVAKMLQQDFLHSVNVGFYIIINNKVNLITYERGVGFTQACGTNAAALGAYLIYQDIIKGNIVFIEMPGGNLTVTWDKISSLKLQGSAEEVFTGIIPICS